MKVYAPMPTILQSINDLMTKNNSSTRQLVMVIIRGTKVLHNSFLETFCRTIGVVSLKAMKINHLNTNRQLICY